MKIYAVIDTNVLVSAMLKWSSVPGSILEFVFSGIITPVLSEKIVAEYREVLMRKKFHLTEDIVEDIISILDEQGEYIDPGSMEYELPDPKDVSGGQRDMVYPKESPLHWFLLQILLQLSGHYSGYPLFPKYL